MDPIILTLVVEKAEQIAGTGGFSGQEAVLITTSDPRHPETERLTFVVDHTLAPHLGPYQRLKVTVAMD